MQKEINNEKISLKELGLRFKETRKERDFNKLYDRIKIGLYNYAYNILKNSHEANDVVTVTMAKVWSRIDQYNENWHISTWIYSIAYKNAILPLLHEKKMNNMNIVRLDVDTDKEDSTSIVSKIEYSAIDKFVDNLVQNENMQNKEILITNVMLHISNLPDNLKGPISAKYFDDLSYEEIGQRFDINLQTVKNRIFKAKQVIKNSLIEDYNNIF